MVAVTMCTNRIAGYRLAVCCSMKALWYFGSSLVLARWRSRLAVWAVVVMATWHSQWRRWWLLAMAVAVQRLLLLVAALKIFL